MCTTRREVSRKSAFWGWILEVDKWGFLCYNRNKFHCVKDAVKLF